MQSVPVRELNQNTAGVLARVQGGQEVEITSHGKPVARLVPIVSDPFAALAEAGELRRAIRDLDLAAPDERPVAGDLAASVSEDREDLI